ncbi:MAG: prepilin peptidase [Burkholderiales bacterium]|nr:prepilin peptidase [Burkholderiales bacterium]MDR4517494.1 A24 family peptidase [Nitrosomonas sp.]
MIQLLIYALLIILLLNAALQDYRGYRIKNSLVISGAFLGILLNTVTPVGLGFYASLIGWSVGLLLLLPFYMFRMMGAGDVKLVAMVGAFLGPQATITALLYILVAGGVLSIYVAWHRGLIKEPFCEVRNLLRQFIVNLVKCNIRSSPSFNTFTVSPDAGNRLNESASRLPYGVAIAAGTLIFLAVNLFSVLD